LGLQHHALYFEKLQRMAGNVDIEPLLAFADILEPPSIAVRKRAQTYFSHTPLNRLVDTLMPESNVAREFAGLVERIQMYPDDSAEAAEKARETLTLWVRNTVPLQSIIERSYLLKETEPLAEITGELCRRGIEALNYLETHRKPPEAWQAETSALLKRAEKPDPEIRIAVLLPITNLIKMAVDQP